MNLDQLSDDEYQCITSRVYVGGGGYLVSGGSEFVVIDLVAN
jgi:hypothetical protein